ncbi:MAG: NUDIX hydrolase [Boseongicola sp.]|nr:NUDIX hydrolase [Boseongicola sp.]MDD9979624.1 NUDIX hydrolase [Boseongicola sp.]
MTPPFNGAKLAILVKDQVVTILRDDKPGLAWPGYWDLPGGGREGSETPIETAIRETKEEIGVNIDRELVSYSATYPAGDSVVWFFVAEAPDFGVADIVFGNEGQCWRLAPTKWFLEHRRAIPHLQDRLNNYLRER